jgi:formylglycine-generating enzyme required for sulfatase activity
MTDEGGKNDPPGPNTGSYRVNRGGSWDYDAGYARSAFRSWNMPGYRNDNLGFRLVLPSGQ